jgi:hypothetical protein
VFFIFFEIGSCYAAQANLELMTFLSQPPECWDYRLEPPLPDIQMGLYY